MSANDFTNFDTSPTGIYGATDFSTAQLNGSSGFADMMQTINLLDQSAIATFPLYRMRGYNPGTLSYETWITQTPSNNNPSGNALVGITIEAKLVSTT